jgi:hypothetical protein
MPIRADLRHFYGREWRLVTRPRILARAENRCEQCGVPNHVEVTRVGGFWLEAGASWALGAFRRWRTAAGAEWSAGVTLGRAGILRDPPGRMRRVRIVLSTAHVNHQAGDDRDGNLKALCQWCHLNYDLRHHHETRATRKDAARPLLNTAREASL